MDEKPPRRRINWFNVLLVFALGSPVLYLTEVYLTKIFPPPYDAPTISSPEGRRIFREWMARSMPELFVGRTGVKK